MATPAETVGEVFSNATSYATAAKSQTESYVAALQAAVYAAPTFDLTWTPIDAPTATTMPDLPVLTDSLDWNEAATPADFADAAPSIVIDDFAEAAPTLDFGLKPTLDFGVAPTLSFGVAPTVSDPAAIALPDAPTITLPAAPTYLTLSTPTFAGVDLHAAFLTNLENIPTLDLVAPTPYSYTPGPEYASTLLTTLKAKLLERMAGGTGLAPAVEQALWDRGRSREAKLGQANEDTVGRTSEALGWHLPAGVTAAQLREAQQDTFDKASSLSREITIKQAELEQANLKDTIAAGMDLEGKLIEYSFRLEQLAFENAKAVADNAIQLYNAELAKFKELLDSYRTYAAVYDTLIKGEQLKVEVLRAELAAEQTKADINKTLVEEYKAGIEASMSLVRIYEAQIGAAKTLVELEGAKLAAKGEQIKAYIAGINGETAKVEAFKANAQAQGIVMDAWGKGVQAELGKVELYKAKAQAFSAKASAQGEKARANVAYYDGRARAFSAKWSAWEARVKGETSRFQALAAKSGMLLDGFKAGLAKAQAMVEQDVKRWQIGISQYEAQKNYSLAVEKINTEVIQGNRQAMLDAAKTGAQIFAQLTSSAYSMIHASAGVSASASNSVGYSYSNDTSSTVAPITSI